MHELTSVKLPSQSAGLNRVFCFRSCCCDADDMADEQRAETYIVKIPYSVLLSIYQSLDADKGWEALGEYFLPLISMVAPEIRW